MADTPCIDTGLSTRPVEPLGWDLGTHPRPTGGAEIAFVGRTRPETHPEYGSLTHLYYEAQEAMAATILEDLATEAASRWSLRAVRLLHAVGVVEPGAGSVVVEVVADHRDRAYLASRWLIDTIKHRLPVWKQSCWQRGKTWSDGTPASPAPAAAPKTSQAPSMSTPAPRADP